MPRKILVSAALAAASVLALAGCAGATPGSSGSSAAADGKVQVVASTNVYGDIAAAIGGDRVDVTSIISSTAQDPHSYEASAKDQLTISRAGLIIENGGGYDSFMDGLLEGSEARVIDAVAALRTHADMDAALEEPATRAEFLHRLQALRAVCETFVNALRAASPPTPYGLQFVARAHFDALRTQFPHAHHTDIVRAVAYTLYHSYIHPAIVAPEEVNAFAPFGQLTAGAMDLSRADEAGDHLLNFTDGVRLIYQP